MRWEERAHSARAASRICREESWATRSPMPTLCEFDPTICDGTFDGDNLVVPTILTGTIPTEIGLTLAKLRGSVNLDNCQFSGTLPTQLGRMNSPARYNQRILSFRIGAPMTQGPLVAAPRLSGTLPTELGNVTAAQVFLSGLTLLSGTLPTELGLATSFGELDIQTTRLSGTIPTQIGLQRWLYQIQITESFISGTLPVELVRLNSLKYALSFRGNRIEGHVPWVALTRAEHHQTWKVDTLDLSGNAFSGTIPPMCARGLELPRAGSNCRGPPTAPLTKLTAHMLDARATGSGSSPS